MNAHEIIGQYKVWLCSLVCYNSKRYDTHSYRKLFNRLFTTAFRYEIYTDGNRYSDGIDLRYRFGEENDIEAAAIACVLDNRDCSILEMMIALAARFESQIMYDEDYGDRTGDWFWAMIESLKLDSMNDAQYDETFVSSVLDIFLESGVLFDVPQAGMNPTCDIWWQLNRYAIGKEGV